MKIVFSRKGFDSSAGGGPSPIVDGRPISLPIPASGALSRTTYGELGLGEHAASASRGRLGADSLCHHDPMFLDDGRAILGQCSAAQTHLERQGVGEGDVFLFFGLFREGKTPPHHRIFAFLKVEEMLPLATASPKRIDALRDLGMPHAIGMHAANDVAWIGRGRTATRASDRLRLTVPEGPPSLWRIPPWLAETGLSYHDRPSRWERAGRLQSVARGQEFVADIGERSDAKDWLAATMEEI
ncbi:hypothetical protein [Aurantiacibacter gangjinensis]|uniref:Uncharacterized protein n=1 Tax=Aurantiacibacter gangjinensis TaxID=502682 RepID=A0A0G9MM47_9SPHN|nr:hypothetical protein [Aurantiacibacter gangjinensis]APE27770.1 hypothetical protein BMF35_a0941 [Aurantiacibacter gangjinensis]KLE31765.1 hypothetical protein AAW01_09680 [Aurantiacibacter gangjinensis]